MENNDQGIIIPSGLNDFLWNGNFTGKGGGCL